MTGKENTLGRKYDIKQEKQIQESRSNGQSSVTLNERRFSLCRSEGKARVLTTIRHVLQAARNPVDLDDRQANAVAARIELDLRIGASFTRLQTLQLQSLGGALDGRIISYGKHILHLVLFLADSV